MEHEFLRRKEAMKWLHEPSFNCGFISGAELDPRILDEPSEDPLGTDDLGKRLRFATECLGRHPGIPSLRITLEPFEFSAKHAALAGELLSLLGAASEVSVADSAAVLRRVACMLDGDAPEVRRS
jgi:hypothetical protein